MADYTPEQVRRGIERAREDGNMAAVEELTALLSSISGAETPQPRERMRTAAQGATFGFADEIEAALRSLGPEEYGKALEDIRGRLAAYKEARPGEAFAYEMGGAVAPAMLPVPGGRASLMRTAARAAGEGALYAYGTGEGGVQERLSRVPGGALVGGGAGVLGQQATRLAAKPMQALADAARRVIGGRGSTLVESEIQRLVRQTGKSADEIAQDIIDGRLLAENQTIRMAVRALRAQGGDASRIITESMTPRPAETRGVALQQLRDFLGEGGADSQAARRAASEDATRLAERQTYAPFKGQPISQEATDALADALRRVPEASKAVSTKLRAETGQSPFFNVGDDGTITFTRAPTADEAEAVRRAIGGQATALYRDPAMATAGEAVSGVERRLRDVLDVEVPGLADTRATAALVRSNRDAYEAGLKSFSGDVNENLVQFSRLQQGKNADEAIAAYRAGLLQAIEARGTRGTRQAMIRNLANPETAEGKIFLQVFPEDEQAKVLQTLDIANQANDAAQKILQGSPTADTLMEASRQADYFNAGDVSAALNGSPVAAANIASRLASKVIRTELTDAERARIAALLVSRDPQIVRRAILDESGMADLVNAIEALGEGAASVARTGGAMQGGTQGGEASQGLLGVQ